MRIFITHVYGNSVSNNQDPAPAILAVATAGLSMTCKNYTVWNYLCFATLWVPFKKTKEWSQNYTNINHFHQKLHTPSRNTNRVSSHHIVVLATMVTATHRERLNPIPSQKRPLYETHGGFFCFFLSLFFLIYFYSYVSPLSFKFSESLLRCTFRKI